MFMYSMSKYNISLKCHLSIGIGIVCTQDLKYELWHFVGGANLAQNLRLPNHCHFHKDLSSDNLQSICTVLSFSQGGPDRLRRYLHICEVKLYFYSSNLFFTVLQS